MPLSLSTSRFSDSERDLLEVAYDFGKSELSMDFLVEVTEGFIPNTPDFESTLREAFIEGQRDWHELMDTSEEAWLQRATHI